MFIQVSGNGHSGEKVSEENSDFDRAVSLSLKVTVPNLCLSFCGRGCFLILRFLIYCNLKCVQTAEQEKAIREMQLNDKNQEPGVYSTWKVYLLFMVELHIYI